MPIRVGLIGAGRIGTLHAENLARHVRGVELAGVADIDRQRATETGARAGAKRITTACRELVESPEIDALVICSATNTHAEIIEAAARAGKHVFCEKPVDLELERVRKLVHLVGKTGIKFAVGFNRRFDRNFKNLRDRVHSGELGPPQLLRITSRDPAPPPLAYLQASGGIFLDMTIHDFDMARFVIGSEIKEVFATGRVLIDPVFEKAGDVDTALTTLIFENSVLGCIDNSRQAVYGYDQRVEVLTSTGMITAGNETKDRTTLIDAQGTHSAKPVYFFLERYRDAYIAEMQAFIDCIAEDTPPSVTARDGLMALAAGLAAQKSLATNRPVPLSEFAID